MLIRFGDNFLNLLNSSLSICCQMDKDHNELPINLINTFVKVTPRTVLAGLMGVMVRRMERRHPQLFQNLAKMDDTVLRVEPTDLPYRFAFHYGKGGAGLKLLDDDDTSEADAGVAGRLEILLQMLEGTLDGDMLFFARELSVTGNSSVVVELRNTLEREEIHLLDDAMSFFGPLSRPAARVVTVLEKLVRHVTHDGGAGEK
jgi:O2-independent ubiquinone biosynthesis accessory factor UbiT